MSPVALCYDKPQSQNVLEYAIRSPACLRHSSIKAQYSKADGWVHGHGTCCLAAHGKPMLGLFLWMPNSAREGKRLGEEWPPFSTTVCMDSKADDQKLYFARQAGGLQLLTRPRRGKDKSPQRQQMIQEMNTPAKRKLYRERGQMVEPMPGLLNELFDL